MHVIVVIIVHNEKLMHHILLNIIIFSISTFEFTFKFFQRKLKLNEFSRKRKTRNLFGKKSRID